MIDLATLVSLLAPILLIAVCDRILRWRFARSRRPAEEPRASAGAGEVTTPRAAAAASSADAEAERPPDRQVA